MHPDHHVGLEEWLKCIDNAIETGERFFKEHINDMYDAMPAVWKNHLTPELRHEVVSVIDQFYENAAPSNEVWSKANVLKLVKFAPLAQVPKLRATYFAAKRNGRIMVGGIDDSNSRDDTERPPAYEPFHLCTWKPRVLTARYVANHSDNETQVEYLNHISNFVAGQHWDKSETSMLAPSDHLDLAITADQQRMLNPTTKDVIIGSILNDTMGEGAKKKLAKRRIELLSGNIASYSRVLNSEAQLQHVKDMNSLTAVLGEISAEQDAAKEKKSNEKKLAAAEKEKQKAKAQMVELAKKEALMPELAAIVASIDSASVDVLGNLNIKKLKELLKYFFGSHRLSTLKKKADLVAEAKEWYTEYKAAQLIDDAANDPSVNS
jgi:hypothetical protein